MPAYGNDPSNVADQLGYGEKQGADSGRPEIQTRLVLQWQLDKAPGVAPAQFIVSGVQGNRKAWVRASDVPLCSNTDVLVCPDPKVFQKAFPQGAERQSNRAGWTGEIQLPTRYVTVLGKFWSGSDLRWYFVGALDSNFNDTAGMTKRCGTDTEATFCSGSSNDGASTVLFGLNSAGTPVIAPQRPVRAIGGFLDLAFPLGRIFGADPAGRNAGWQVNFHYAFDQAKTSDVLHLGNQRSKNDLAAATLVEDECPGVVRSGRVDVSHSNCESQPAGFGDVPEVCRFSSAAVARYPLGIWADIYVLKRAKSACHNGEGAIATRAET